MNLYEPYASIGVDDLEVSNRSFSASGVGVGVAWTIRGHDAKVGAELG